jgi:hypothetical protein
MKRPLSSNYPLYIVLKKDAMNCAGIDKKKLRETFISSLSRMNQDEFDSVFIILKIHSGKNNMIPFDGIRKENGDISFNFNKFPLLLQRMLYSFAIRFNDNVVNQIKVF